MREAIDIRKFGEEYALQYGHFPSYGELPVEYRQAMAEHWMRLKLENQWCCICKHWSHLIEDEGVCEVSSKETTYDDSCDKWSLKNLPEWALALENKEYEKRR